MAQASVGWRTMSGQRLTSQAFRPEICVEAETSADPSTENGIDRVEFVVTDANGSTTVTVSQRQARRPNYSAVASPLIQDSTGEMAAIEGYGFRLKPAAYAAGTITITATVYSRAGTATPLPWPIRLYNDTDGGDRRPSTKRIFVSPTGNDANPGTELQPVKEFQTAVGLCRANTAGASLSDRDCGGAEIVVMPGVHLTRNFFGAAAVHTSGDWWLTFTFQAGAIVQRADLAGTSPFLAFGSLGAGTNMRIRWVGAVTRGLPPVWFNDASVVSDWWFDGCTKTSAHYTPSNQGPRWSVQYMEDTLTAFSAQTSTGPNARQFYSNCVAVGCLGGFSAYQLAQDCGVGEYIGIALELFDLGNGGGHTCNVIVEEQRALRELGGRVRGSIAGCTITVPAAGQMRIQQNAAPTFPMTSLATLSDIANRDHWRVKCSGLVSGNNGDFRVLSAGTSGGFGYVILDNPTAVAQTAGVGSLAETAAFVAGVVSNASANCTFSAGTSTITRFGAGSFITDGFVVGNTVRIEYGTKLRRATVTSVSATTMGLYLGQTIPTWEESSSLAAVVAGYFEPDIVHSDIMFFAGTTQTNSMTSGVCTRDIDSTQSFFNPTPTLIRSSFCNNRDGGYVSFAANMAGGGRTDYVFHNNTIAGVLQLPSGGQTRVSFVNNVMGSMSGLQSGGYCNRNHLISGAVPGFGSNWTTGAWFAFDQFATPWWYQPLPQWIGTGASVAPHPAETWWLGATATTPGCNRLVGLFNWAVAPVSSIPEIAGNVDFPVTVDGTLSPIATVSGNVDFFFGVDGALVPGSLLGGNVDFAVSVDGILTSFALLSGNVDFAVTIDGALQSGSTVAGDVDFAIVVDGPIVPGSLLSGDVDFSFTVDGGITQLDGDPPVLFSGDVDFPFAVDGDLLAGADLAGNVDFAVTVDGQLQAGATVGGNVDFRLATDGQLERLPFFTGNVDFLVTVDGTLESANSIDTYFAPRQAPGELRRWPLRPPTFWE